ncbi:AbrB/MazE/SpoVT family DNA-binding domain-containing protein [Planococcus kocurii]|uniref:AbrB/MazE/SpoVT family DNA-binding domain-containing protein n=1 Tax=Planococcus kocurii TaxID=1374 RepID=UPI003D0062B4
MKSTGIVRQVDPLGRIVIPKELRKSLDLKESDPVEIFMETDRVILKKYEAHNACFITGDVLDSNIHIGSGLVLSPEGAKMLLQELEEVKKQ